MRVTLIARVTDDGPGGRRTILRDPATGAAVFKAFGPLPDVVDGATYDVTIEPPRPTGRRVTL